MKKKKTPDKVHKESPSRGRKKTGFSLTKKLIYSFLLLNVILIALGVLGIVNLGKTQQMSNSIVVNQLLPLQSLTKVQTQMEAIQTDLYKTMASNTVQNQINYQEDIQNRQTAIDKELNGISHSYLYTADQKQWTTFVSDLGNSVVAINNDFTNIRNHQFTKGKVTLTSTKNVTQTIGDLDKLIAFEQNAAQQTARQGHSVYETALWVSITVIVVALLISVALGTFILRATIRPIRVVTRELEHIAKSNGDLTKRLNIGSRDEFGQLAAAFNAMIESIQKMVRTIADSTEEMAATSEELSATSTEVMNISVQISSRTQDISSGASQQLAATENVTNKVNGMADYMENLRTHSHGVSDSSTATKSRVLEGRAAIDETGAQLKTVSESIYQLSKQMNALGEQVGQISSIVELITGIADQSHLLSLNATIEAERAGSAGRGFAVVAEEMRTMAKHSKDAALQIRGLAKHIQGEMQAVQDQMDSSQKQAEAGVGTMHTSADAFTQISTHVDHVHQQIQGSLQDIEQMQNSVQEVRASIADILSIADGFRQSTEDVAAATEEQSATLEETSASLEHLTRHAESLTQLIDQFNY